VAWSGGEERGGRLVLCARIDGGRWGAKPRLDAGKRGSGGVAVSAVSVSCVGVCLLSESWGGFQFRPGGPGLPPAGVEKKVGGCVCGRGVKRPAESLVLVKAEWGGPQWW